MDFSKEIANFQKTGAYTYQIDGGGNLLTNSKSPEFNQHYISIPLYNNTYNQSKLDSFYPSTFTEFISTPIEVTTASASLDLQSQLAQAISENVSLNQQLSDIANLQQSNSSVSDELAARQTIVSLRILLNQGKQPSDFSTTFPYIPLK